MKHGGVGILAVLQSPMVFYPKSKSCTNIQTFHILISPVRLGGENINIIPTDSNKL